MTNLQSVPDESGRHIEVTYDGDGCSAVLYDGETRILGTYAYVRVEGGWEAARNKAVDEVKEKFGQMKDYGPKPGPETIPYD